MAGRSPERLLDRRVIGERLRADPLVHLYELADLDDFFFPDCSYWSAGEDGPVALLYGGSAPPTLLALGRETSPALEALVTALAPSLPRSFYAHLAPGLSAALADRFVVEPRGMHEKLALPGAASAAAAGSDACEPVTVADLDAVLAFYRGSYPDTWFVPRMLETGAYFGVWDPLESTCRHASLSIL